VAGDEKGGGDGVFGEEFEEAADADCATGEVLERGEVQDETVHQGLWTRSENLREDTSTDVRGAVLPAIGT